MFLYSLFVPLFSFILQVWPRLINRYFGIDTWRHLLLADYVRRYHKIPTVLEEQYIRSSGDPGYPPVIYLILSRFSKGFTERYQFIFAPFFDAIQNYCIFWFAYLITNDITSAICAQVIAALTPIAVIEASNLSTRTLSYLIFTLSFLSLVIFSITNLYIWLFIAFVMLIVLFLTHKFAIQAYLFISTGFSIAEKDPFYILFFLGTFIFMYTVMKKIYRPILKEHMLILSFWRRNISDRFIHQFRGHSKSDQVKDFVHKIYLISFKNPYVYMLGNNPWVGMLTVLIVVSTALTVPIESMIVDQNVLNKLYIWIWTAVIIGLLTLSVEGLRFLGEGNRYLEYCILPISIVLGSYIPSFLHSYGTLFITSAILFLLILIVYILYIQINVVLKDRMRTITPELWDCIKYLNKFGKKARVAVFPLQFGDALTYFINGKVLTTYNNEGLTYLTDIYPVVKKPIDKIMKKFNINFILFDESYVTLEEIGLSQYQTIINKNGYILLRI